MSNELVPYFESQAGSGISGFQGIRYQRGNGFFGRLLSKAIYPMLRFFGKQALNTGVNIASDVIKDKKNFKQSLKTRGMEAGQSALEAGLKRAQRFQQTGEGRRRKRRRSKRKSVKNLRFLAKPHKKRGRKRKTRKTKSIKRRKRSTKRSKYTLF